MNVRAVIVPGGGANFGSLRVACARIGVETEVSDDAARIRAASHVLLPGVGAAAHAMREMRERGLDRVLPTLSQPLLGICLGMQLLFDSSEESLDANAPAGGTPTACLGIVPGVVRRLPAAPSWPHMGWNTLRDRADHPLLAGIGGGDWFYFVHGFAAPAAADTIAASEHGGTFAAAVARGNVYGAQFHPEKSAAAGRRLLANFFALT